MRKFLRFIFPALLALLVVASVFWYLLDYDKAFTRDFLLKEAKLNDARGNSTLSAWFYKLAYAHSGNDEEVAIELANRYKADGNYTQTEVLLSKSISSEPSARLYTALCSTYVEQDKLLDAVALLADIPDESIRAQIEAERPTTPVPTQEPGFYNTYISVELTSSKGTIYYTTNGEYPSVNSEPYSEPITLSLGETVIYCISVDENGLVSPVNVLSYTVGGVVELAEFMDAEVESAARSQLGMTSTEDLYTNDLWEITEFTVPAGAWTLEDLSMFTYLQSLTITNLPDGSLQYLSGLTELQALDLTGCRFDVSELSVLEQLPKLEKLVLSDCGLSTIANLRNVVSLTYLDISSNTIRDLEPLSGMTQLKELYMSLNAVNSLDVLASLYNLEKLDVSYNSISTLVALAQCPKLSYLDVSHNTITSVNGIANLQLLTTLDLDYNSLTDISTLGGCIQLQVLTFSNNSVTDISSLASLTSLDTIDFSYNSIYALPDWPQTSTLRVVNGSYNNVSNIDVLSGMSSLTYISMEYNSLTDISSLANCPNLVQVNVYGNSISDVSALTARSIIVNYDPTVQ